MYWSAASVWYPLPLRIFISLSIFTLNGHLCDRHLPLPGDSLTGWKSPASLLPLSAPLLASLMPTGILHLVSQSNRSASRHLRPGSWPEGLKPGMADTWFLGSHFPQREGQQPPASKWDCPNKQTNKQKNKCQIQTQVKEPHTLRKTQSEDSRTPLSGAFTSHAPRVPESWWGGRVVLGFLWSESTPSSPRCAWKKVVTVQTSDLFPDKITFTLRG